MVSERRLMGIYERWLYRFAIQGTNGDGPVCGPVTLVLPALLTELVLEGEWLETPSMIQRTARDALVAHMNVMCPTLAIRTDVPLVGTMTATNSKEVVRI